MTADRLLLLDTSVVLHLVRGNEVAKRMDAAYALRTRTDRPLVSIVSLGEARSFALQLDWGDSKVDLLERLLRELTVVDIHNATVLAQYAKIDAFAKRNGRILSDNDTWIAATAAAADALLITNDKDFDALHGQFIERIYVPPKAEPAT